jgi:5'-AMP-activated protein kinase regulatory beta subunit
MTKTLRSGRDKNETMFSYHAPGAKTVFLAGSFNEWNREATPMERQEDGGWSVSLKLPPGHYEYKFVVDGDWCCEPGRGDTAACPHCVPNPFGTMNLFLEVQGQR